MFAFILTAFLAINTQALASEETETKNFHEDMVEAFKKASHLGLDVIRAGQELWSGECVTVTKKGDKIDRIFLGEQLLVLKSSRNMGKQVVSFGMGGKNAATAGDVYKNGYAFFGDAYVSDLKDLTIAYVTNWYKGEGSTVYKRRRGHTTLRQGKAFGYDAYLFASSGLVWAENAKMPEYETETYCYFDEKK